MRHPTIPKFPNIGSRGGPSAPSVPRRTSVPTPDLGPFTEDTGDFTVSVANLWSGTITGWTNTLTTGVTFNTTTKVLTVDTDLTGPLDNVPIVLLPYNDEGDADQSVGWLLTVYAAPTTPYAIGTVPAQSWAVGDVIDFDFAPYIGGTRPMTLSFASGAGPTGPVWSGERLVGTITAAGSGSFVPNAANVAGNINLNSVPWAAVAPGSFIGRSSEDGDWLEIDLPAGFSGSNTTVVNPAGVTITQTVQSVSDTGVPNTRNLAVKAGYRADIVSTKLRIWTRGNISPYATAISLSVSAGAITNGASSNGAISGSIQPLTTVRPHTPKMRLAGIVTGKYALAVEHDIVATDFFVEAEGGADVAGLFEVTVTDGTTTQTQYSLGQVASRYCDYVYLGYAARDNSDGVWPTKAELKTLADGQWAKNATANGDANRGGLGVLSHATAFDPTDFTDGALTITAKLYSFAGGVSNVVTESWVVYNNAGGSYTARDRYWSPTGNDANDGLTSGTPVLTLAEALRKAASSNGGATQFSIPRVLMVGSGDPDNPAVFSIDGTSALNTTAKRAGITDTYVTITPASGHDDRDTRMVLASNGPAVRARRMKFKDCSIAIDGASGTDTRLFVDASPNYFDSVTNPQSMAVDGCSFFHSGGRDGNSNSASAYACGTLWKTQRVHWVNHTARDMYRVAHSVLCDGMLRNAAFLRTTNDSLKGPKGLNFAVYGFDNVQPRTNLTMAGVIGTPPVPGETLHGVYSDGTGTVTAVQAYSTSEGIKYKIVITDLTGRFKEDDNTKHHAVTVPDASAFVVGQNIRTNGTGTDRMLLRKDGNILRVARNGSETSIVLAGQAVTQPSSGASTTASANSVLSGSLVFSGGATGNYTAIHPDVVQVQAFRPCRIIVTPVSGTLAVGQTISKDGATSPIQVIETISGHGTALTIGGTGNVTWFDTDQGNTFTTNAGTSFVFNYLYDCDPYGTSSNLVLSNMNAVAVEGAPFFAENSSWGMLAKNVSYISGDGTRENAFQWARVQDLTLMHMSAFQRPVWDRTNDYHRPRASIYMFGLLGEEVDYPYAGQDITACHGAAPGQSANFSDVTSGSYLNAAGIGYDDDAPAFDDFSPTPGQADIERAPANVWAKFDMFGNPRPQDGTARIGGMEEWVDTPSGATAPAQMSAPTVTALSSTSISVDRAAAPADGGSAITSYDLRWSVDGAGSWTTVTGITDPQTVSSLVTRTNYEVQTRAVNAIGAGDWSTSGTVTTPAPAISIIGTTDGNATTLTMPGGQLTGDLLVVFAGRTTNGTITLPGAPGDWTLAHTETNSDGGNSIIAWRVASADGESVGTWTGATYMGIHVIRNATGIGGIAGAYVAGAGTPSLPALTMTKTDGTSMLFGGIFQRGSQTFTAVPSGYTKRSASALNGRYRMDHAAQSSAPSASFGAAISGSTSATVIHAEILNG